MSNSDLELGDEVICVDAWDRRLVGRSGKVIANDANEEVICVLFGDDCIPKLFSSYGSDFMLLREPIAEDAFHELLGI